MSIEAKFARLSTDDAPGQEIRKKTASTQIALRGTKLAGLRTVDFSHGDVDAFPPAAGTFEAFAQGVSAGGRQAYTEYRGDAGIRDLVAERLAAYSGAPVEPADGLIITPGTQGALFLAVACTVGRGSKVAIVQPDYFANRKLVAFMEGTAMPVRLDYLDATGRAGLDLGQLEDAFQAGARVLLLSNPNNPTGAVYAADEMEQIAVMADSCGATVIVDQLYARLLFPGTDFVHLRALRNAPENIVTIMGPSKYESLSGYRLGVAFGTPSIISRMEKLQAIMCLRAAGYNQAVLRAWLSESTAWLNLRIAQHQAIRDDLLGILRASEGVTVRTPDAGSYLFPTLPELGLRMPDFVTALRVQAGVIVTPGTEFSPDATGSIRLNFSQDHRAALRAMDRLVALVDRYRT